MNEFISHKDIGYRLAKARGLYGLKMDSKIIYLQW